MLFNIIKKVKRKVFNLLGRDCDCRNKDEIHLNLDGLEIFLERCFAYDKPHEVSIFVPRAELRKTVTEGDQVEEIEILLNSITVVHSPQRPSDEGEGEGNIPEPPEIPRENIKIGKNKKVD